MAGELDILYRDDAVIVVDKPAGMLVHPGRDPEPREQVAMKVLRDQLGQKVWPIHRLDRPTSGALMFGLHAGLEKEFHRQFSDQVVEKRYTAVVLGKTPWKWTAEAALRKAETEPYREAETRFTRKGSVRLDCGDFSLLEAMPRTGRYHQIRKHLAADDHPIVGDYLYGEPDEMDRVAASVGQPRLMLHASRLTFVHPVQHDEIRVDCPLPDRFAPFLPAGEERAVGAG